MFKSTEVILTQILKGAKTVCSLVFEDLWKTLVMEQKHSAGHMYPSKSLTFHQSQ